MRSRRSLLITSIWPVPVSITGIRTGGAGGLSSGFLRRGSTSGSGSDAWKSPDIKPKVRVFDTAAAARGLLVVGENPMQVGAANKDERIAAVIRMIGVSRLD